MLTGLSAQFVKVGWRANVNKLCYFGLNLVAAHKHHEPKSTNIPQLDSISAWNEMDVASNSKMSLHLAEAFFFILRCLTH